MLNQRITFLILLVLASTVLAASCQSHASVPQRQVAESSKGVPQPLSTPLQVQHLLANYKTYDIPEELESSADLIIVGRPQTSLEDSQSTSILESEKAKNQPRTNQSVVVRNDQGSIIDRYTITSVKAQKVFKGKVEAKEIMVLQPAAVVQEPNQSPFISLVEDYSPLKKNVKYLLFLKQVDTATYPNLAGVYSIMSVNQGKFNFDKVDSGETNVEGQNEQYRQLKAKVKKKYEAQVNAVP